MYRGVEQLVARRAHNPEVGGSSPPPATQKEKRKCFSFFRIGGYPPTIFTFPLNPPLTKGDFSGGVSQPLYKKRTTTAKSFENEFEILTAQPTKTNGESFGSPFVFALGEGENRRFEPTHEASAEAACRLCLARRRKSKLLAI